MKCHTDATVATLGLALAAAAMASVVGTSGYARAVATEARGYDALFRVAHEQRHDLPSLTASSTSEASQ